MNTQSKTRCERRERILDAATQLFQHYGFAKTTVADIAKQAKVGVGSVYLEFSGKDAIMEALSNGRYELVLRAMIEAAQSSAPFDERVAAVLNARARAFMAQANGGTHAPDLIQCHCPGTMSAHSRYLDAEKELLVVLLKEGRETGFVRLENLEEGARALQAAYHLTAPPWLFKRQEKETERLLASLHSVVIYGLVRR